MTNSVIDSQATPQTEPNPETGEDWLFIGRITGAHGLNGHVKVFAESDFPERFTTPGERWLQRSNGGKPAPVRLLSGKFVEGKKHYIVKLEGINFRDQAEDLRQARLMVPASDRLAVDPGEFHVADLLGLTVVVHADQSTIGTVTDVFTTGHDMLEVTVAPKAEDAENEVLAEAPADKTKDMSHPSMRAKAAAKLKRQVKRNHKKKRPKTLLIPFVEEIVPVVDIAAGRIEVTPPPGLLDL